jgi:alpha-1,3-mannosyltransferase
MNMLLYAPGVLLVLLMGTGFHETIVCLGICAGLQIVLGYPFLSTYPIEYISRSFDLGRVFMYKWTVNFKFLREDVFVGKPLSVLLLVCTAVGMAIFGYKWISEVRDGYNSYLCIFITRLSPVFLC